MLVLRTRSDKLERIRFAPDGRGLAAGGPRGLFWWQSIHDDETSVWLDWRECCGLGFAPDGEQIIAGFQSNSYVEQINPGFGGLYLSGIRPDDRIVETVHLGGQ